MSDTQLLTKALCYPMKPALPVQVQMFGQFTIRCEGDLIRLPAGRPARSLLAFLILHSDQAHSRTKLAALFWPESNEGQSRTNLRREIHRIRTAHPLLGGRVLAEGGDLRWVDQPETRFDIERFLHLVDCAQKENTENASLETRARAIQAYRGEFLVGFNEDWVLQQREYLSQQQRALLEELATQLIASQQYEEAIRVAQVFITHDPMAEVAYRLKMQAQVKRQDRVGAIRTYQTCAAMLKSEFGVEPDANMGDLYRALQVPKTVPTTPALAMPRAALADPTVALVGREEALNALLSCWQSAGQNKSHLAVIEGEPGAGKTRLANELIELVSRESATIARARARAGAGSLSLAPVCQWLTEPAILTGLAQRAPAQTTALAKLLPGLALLEKSTMLAGQVNAHSIDRHLLWYAIAQGITTLGRPTLLFLDDLQWCDHDTLEWLGYLLHRNPDARLLVMATLRTGEVDESHPLNDLLMQLEMHAQLSRIELVPLAPDQARTLAQQTSLIHPHNVNKPHDSSIDIEAIVARSAGNPLFVIEWVRSTLAAVASGGAAHTRLPALPAKIHALYRHRLKLLSANARQIIYAASVIGGVFNRLLLSQTTSLRDERIHEALDELWQARLIRAREPGAYEFEHDCAREAVYSTLRPVRRRLLHGKVAAAMHSVNSDDLEPVAGALARHYEMSDDIPTAIKWYAAAATSAEKRMATREVIVMLESALRLLSLVPASPAIEARQARMLLGIANNIQQMDGFSSKQMTAVCTRLEALLPRIDNAILRVQIQNRLRVHYTNGETLPTALEVAQEALQEALSLEDVHFHVEAHRAVGQTQFLLGRFRDSERSFRLAAQSAERAFDKGHLDRNQPAWTVHQLYAWWPLVLWVLGDTAQAKKRLAHSMSLPTHSVHTFSRVTAGQMRTLLFQCLGEVAEVKREWSTIQRLTHQTNNIAAQGSGVTEGWLQVMTGEAKSGISLMLDTIRRTQAQGGTVFMPIWLAHLAQAHLQAGQADLALSAVEEALKLTSTTGQQCWDAELLRLKALALQKGGAGAVDIEQAYLQAVETAQRQGAIALGERTQTSASKWRTRPTL